MAISWNEIKSKAIPFSQKWEMRIITDLNIEAAERMGILHDALKDSGYTGYALEVYLVRLLFCLFAEDTSIFERALFQEYIDKKTNIDGSDLSMHLAHLFQVLNTPKEKRLKNLEENLAAFPYVNGRLFEEVLPIAAFDSKMRNMLLYACSLDWSKISPAIFGSMFQTTMNPLERRNLGAHYTSEENIQKVINPLFLEDLYKEFEKVKGNAKRLEIFHQKIGNLRFLDPACGCGNFLIIAYRELRELELLVLKELRKVNPKEYGNNFLNIKDILKVNIDQFYGIEYDEFPARIAEVAMYLIEHQMNMKVQLEFGNYINSLPLTASANIVHGNALKVDWTTLLNGLKMLRLETEEANVFAQKIEELAEKETAYFDYILGNPPFIGKQMQNAEQKEEMSRHFQGISGYGVLDYVSAWYLKAARFIQNTQTKVAFVSTNSIAQGEQVSILWNELFHRYKIKIHFAHQTFSWSNEARGNAAVYCVIIGFANFDTEEKYIFEYQEIKGIPTRRKAHNISPYLVQGNDLIIPKRKTPLSNLPPISFGSMPNDGGHLLFTEEEKNIFLQKEPEAEKWIKPLISGKEFLHNEKRWCLWLVEMKPNELAKLPEIKKRVEAVEKYRKASNRDSTRNLARFPSLFGEIRPQKGLYIVIPATSSEKRRYIPMGLFTNGYIVNNSCLFVNEANLFIFGILMSAMNVAWVKYVGGRLKSDFRYSGEVVYNNFPFPEKMSKPQQKKIEIAAQKVLDARAQYPESSLAQLYDSASMPKELTKAHIALDKAVDACYRSEKFENEQNRIEHLFYLYEQLTNPLF